MNKEQVLDYVMTTPTNTNPAILNQMLDEISGDGESYDVVVKGYYQSDDGIAGEEQIIMKCNV